MCRIAGVLYDDARMERPVVERMLHAIRHRGPDETGFFADHLVNAGMYRLSINDLGGDWQALDFIR